MAQSAEEEFHARLSSVADATEHMLDRLLSGTPLPGENARPSRFLGAVRYACLNGGKRLRPFLLVETARLFGIESEGCPARWRGGGNDPLLLAGARRSASAR